MKTTRTTSSRKPKTPAKAAPVKVPTDLERAESQARAQLASVVEMAEALAKADAGDDEMARDEAREAIHSDALSVEVRDGWRTPGEKGFVSEFQIYLCAGGPAVRLIGELSGHGEAESVRIEFQDWFTPWVELRGTTEGERAALLVYAQAFYFGE